MFTRQKQTSPYTYNTNATNFSGDVATATIPVDDYLTLRTVKGKPILDFPISTTDALRYMTTRLIVNGELPTRMNIVAALHGEGVTTTALGMATLLAHDTAKRICYVDLNWHWPSPYLGVTPVENGGIAAVLRQGIDVADMLMKTNYDNLTILPAGTLSVKQQPMVARSNTLATLMEELSAQYDHLLLDIPAILTTSDAIPLASLGTACCIVVHQGVSTTSLTDQALKQIDHLPMLGVIMNQVKHQTPSWLLKWIPQE